MSTQVVPAFHINDNTALSQAITEILYPYQEILAQMQNPSTIVPTATPIDVTFRGPASSGDYSNFTRSIYKDLMNLYQVQQGIAEEANIANEGAVEKYNAIVQKIQSLEDKLDAVNVLYASLELLINPDPQNPKQDNITLIKSLYNTEVLYGGFPSYYPTGNPLPFGQRAVYAPKYGQIIGSYSQAPLSKTYLIDPVSGNIINAPGILSVTDMKSRPSNTPFDIDQNSFDFATDGNETDFYRRNVYYSPGQNVQQVDVKYELDIPQQFVNDLRCNYVTIHPYPELQQNINSITAHGFKNNSHIQVMPTDLLGNPIAIQNASKQRFLFPDFDVDTLSVILRANNANFNLQPGMQAFTSGMSVLDIGYITFNQNPSRILIPFTVNNNAFLSITSIDPIVPGISYNIWYDNGFGDIVQTTYNSNIPGMCKTIYVEVVITPSVGVMPVLTSLSLNFVPLFGIK